MAQLVDTAWSPSKTEHIVGTRTAAQLAQDTLFSVVQRELAKAHGADVARQDILNRTWELQQAIDAFVAEANKDRIIALEAELETVCAEGEQAEKDFLKAKNEELVVRNAEEKRIARYNAATKSFNNAKNADLGAFHTNKHIVRKLERIADAQTEVDAALADMNANPLAIPQAVQAKMDAEQRLNTLAARARGLRRELAALRGEPVDATGASAGHSATGLGGLQ